MTPTAFISHVLSEQRRTGRKPHRMALSHEAVCELVAVMRRNPKNSNVPASVPTRGYVMTFVGVEVYVDGD